MWSLVQNPHRGDTLLQDKKVSRHEIGGDETVSFPLRKASGFRAQPLLPVGRIQREEYITMSEDLLRRIDAMFNRDRLWAWGFVIFLWITYIFVFFAVDWVNDDGGIWLALLIGGGLVLLYNTASIASMIKHYGEDKEAIYGIDIRHLDEMRERTKSGKS